MIATREKQAAAMAKQAAMAVHRAEISELKVRHGEELQRQEDIFLREKRHILRDAKLHARTLYNEGW